MSNLTKQQAQWIQEVCDQEEWSLRKDYSGRGMFGRKCIGITGRHINGFTVCAKIIRYASDETFTDADPSELEALIELFAEASVSEDSMGLSQIIYFSNIMWDDTLDEEEDEDEDNHNSFCDEDPE